ncbi:DUF2752 domain-containing protein [Taibaiella koreensis]|uniref:DUF2752 domain-containing protein n=1 Tax=Taibaiella koreensis TaxID=1268548 RepID=UPI000E59B897|nr:DUF2752 domain-containing protein [Taibaiella koreensis]
MRRNQLYVFLLLACGAGYGWLAFSGNMLHEHNTFRLCPWHFLTGLPCPACGVTRALVAILDGKPSAAFYYNPLGFPVFLFLLVAPVWMLRDLIWRQQSFYMAYRRVEAMLQRPPFALIAIVLVLANWIWGISKGL